MRIKLYMDWTIAMPFLEPIYHYIKKNTDWDVHFTARDQDSIQMIKDRGYPFDQGIDNYDWAICCDGWSACPTRNRICTFHGLASKGHELSSNRAGEYKGHYVAISPYIKDILINRMGVPEEKIIDGGLSKLDTITEIPKLREEPKVLYAPTFNHELSSLPVLKDSVLELDNLTVKLHSYTENAKTPYHHNFRNYIKDQKDEDYKEDITNLYLKNDIVIADGGSTAVEPLALGRMLIWVQNPLWLEYYKRQGVTEEEVKTYPEIYFPNKYGYKASSVEDIKRIIKEDYPNYKPPKEEVISKVGNYQVSKAICEHIKQY